MYMYMYMDVYIYIYVCVCVNRMCVCGCVIWDMPWHAQVPKVLLLDPRNSYRASTSLADKVVKEFLHFGDLTRAGRGLSQMMLKKIGHAKLPQQIQKYHWKFKVLEISAIHMWVYRTYPFICWGAPTVASSHPPALSATGLLQGEARSFPGAPGKHLGVSMAMGVPPVIIDFTIFFSIRNQPFVGDPPYMETPMCVSFHV